MRKDIPALVVEYIKANPGCIMRMYSDHHRNEVNESALLNESDWELAPWIVDYPEDYPDISDWSWINQATEWCDGIIINLYEKDDDMTGTYQLSDGTWFMFQED